MFYIESVGVLGDAVGVRRHRSQQHDGIVAGVVVQRHLRTRSVSISGERQLLEDTIRVYFGVGDARIVARSRNEHDQRRAWIRPTTNIITVICCRVDCRVVPLMATRLRSARDTSCEPSGPVLHCMETVAHARGERDRRDQMHTQQQTKRWVRYRSYVVGVAEILEEERLSRAPQRRRCEQRRLRIAITAAHQNKTKPHSLESNTARKQ